MSPPGDGATATAASAGHDGDDDVDGRDFTNDGSAEPTYACPRLTPVPATVTVEGETKAPGLPSSDFSAVASRAPVESPVGRDMKAREPGADGCLGSGGAGGRGCEGSGGEGDEVRAAPSERDGGAPLPPPPPPQPGTAPPPSAAPSRAPPPAGDVVSSPASSDNEEGDEVGPLNSCSGRGKQAEDRYSNYFEERLAMLDSSGPDSLDGLQLLVVPEPEPEYAVPHSGAKPSHVTPTEVRSGAALSSPHLPALPAALTEHASPPLTPVTPGPPTAPSPPPSLPEPPTKLALNVEKHPIYEDIEPSPEERVRSLGEEIYDAITGESCDVIE